MTTNNKSVIAQLRATCAELNITVPEGANKKQLKALIDEYYRTAAVVTTDNGLNFRQTDKPTAEYTVEFAISGYHTIRAESEEAAREWLESEISWYYNPVIGDADITEWELRDSWKEGEEA